MNEKHPLEISFFASMHVWHLRLKNMSELDEEDILLRCYGVLSTLFTHILISKESTGTPHIHALLGSMTVVPKETILSLLREAVFPQLKGNKMHSCVLARSKNDLAKYVLKEDDDYLMLGFTQGIVDSFKKLSYNVDAFKGDQKKILESLELDQITLSEYCVKHIALKARHHQPIYPAAIRAHVTSVGVKTGYIQAEALAQTILGDYWEPWDVVHEDKDAKNQRLEIRKLRIEETRLLLQERINKMEENQKRK